jgi:Galactosyltransferase
MWSWNQSSDHPSPKKRCHPSELKRGYVLAAVSLGLVFQFVQFVRSQKIVMETFNQNQQGELQTIDAPHTDKLGLNLSPESRFQEWKSETDIQSALEQQRTELYQPFDPQTRFDAATFDYRQPAVPTKYSLPPPIHTNQSTVILCLSSRDHFEKRAAIRDSWAKGNDNVYFVIGGPVPRHYKDMHMENPLSTSSLLFQEQARFGDIIDTIHPDTYRSLPYKLHFAMRWVMSNIDDVNWIVKVDDDCVVRVKLLQFFLLRQMNPYHPMVIGTVAVGSRPHRTGKWAEDPRYRENEYPPWAFGSAGYVVSRPVAQYVADHNHYYYQVSEQIVRNGLVVFANKHPHKRLASNQGEDAGLGIWLYESPLQVTWIDSPELRKDEGCVSQLYIIGHDLNTKAIRECFRMLGDEVPERRYVVAFSAGRKDQFPESIRNPN